MEWGQLEVLLASTPSPEASSQGPTLGQIPNSKRGVVARGHGISKLPVVMISSSFLPTP